MGGSTGFRQRQEQSVMGRDERLAEFKAGIKTAATRQARRKGITPAPTGASLLGG